MSNTTQVTVGSNTYQIPNQGANPLDSFWGENVTDWIVDVSNQVNSFSLFVPVTTQTLLNSQTNAVITLLTFNPSLYRRVEIEFSIIRNTTRETGYLTMISTGADWDYNIEYDSGSVPTDITLAVNSGSVVYTSGVIATGTSNLRFRATGIEA